MQERISLEVELTRLGILNEGREFFGEPTKEAITIAELLSGLTNLVFWARNPKLAGKKLKGNKKKEQEWVSISNNEVRHSLHDSSVKKQIASLIFYGRHPELKGNFKSLPADQQQKMYNEYVGIQDNEVQPWLNITIIRGNLKSRTVFIADRDTFKRLPDGVRSYAGHEIAAQFAFIGKNEPKFPVTVIFLEPDRFPSSYNFSDATVSLVDTDPGVYVSQARRQLEANIRSAIGRMRGIRLKDQQQGSHIPGIPDRVGVALRDKQIVPAGSHKLALYMSAAGC